MTQKFKFDIGDNVFVIYDNIIQEGKVVSVGYRKIKNEETISYGVELNTKFNSNSVVNFYEIKCFKSKKELIESL